MTRPRIPFAHVWIPVALVVGVVLFVVLEVIPGIQPSTRVLVGAADCALLAAAIVDWSERSPRTIRLRKERAPGAGEPVEARAGSARRMGT